jgi:hypothetical protein
MGACFSGNENKIQNEIEFRDNENVIVICSTDKEKEMKLKTTQLPDTGWHGSYDSFGRRSRSAPLVLTAQVFMVAPPNTRRPYA